MTSFSKPAAVGAACALWLATACRGPEAPATQPATGGTPAPVSSVAGNCRPAVSFPSYPDNPTAPPAKTFGEGYEFTEDWFTRAIPVWQEHLAEYKGKPNLRYLEVGTFEGMSAIWILQNVLTDPTSTVEGVDPYFDAAVKARAEKNIEHSGHGGRFKLHQGLSADVLPKLTPSTYDVIYIDGSHTADDVLADAVLCWLLLKPGGLLIFDDWQMEKGIPDELRPTVSIDAFITAYRRRLELVHRGYQIMVRKGPTGGCGVAPFGTPIGKYCYDFQAHKLRDGANQEVALTDAERKLVERLLVEQRFGAARGEFEPADVERLGRPALEALGAKLGLKLP